MINALHALYDWSYFEKSQKGSVRRRYRGGKNLAHHNKSFYFLTYHLLHCTSHGAVPEDGMNSEIHQLTFGLG